MTNNGGRTLPKRRKELTYEKCSNQHNPSGSIKVNPYFYTHGCVD